MQPGPTLNDPSRLLHHCLGDEIRGVAAVKTHKVA